MSCLIAIDLLRSHRRIGIYSLYQEGRVSSNKRCRLSRDALGSYSGGCEPFRECIEQGLRENKQRNEAYVPEIRAGNVVPALVTRPALGFWSNLLLNARTSRLVYTGVQRGRFECVGRLLLPEVGEGSWESNPNHRDDVGL